MEKLIELLNEYNIELHWVDRTYKDGFDLWYEQEYMRDFRVAYLISKSFWFIERLVQNDKINFEKADADISKDIVLWREPDFYDFMVYRRFLDEEKVLMLLAISDTPIEDLISYLK